MTRLDKRAARFGDRWRAAEFEGVIDAVLPDSVWVRLIHLTTEREYVAEISLANFPPEDRPFCARGTLFIIGRGGAYVGVKRLKPWTQEELNQINAEANALWRSLRGVMA